jgi:hypothetical protein
VSFDDHDFDGGEQGDPVPTKTIIRSPPERFYTRRFNYQ